MISKNASFKKYLIEIKELMAFNYFLFTGKNQRFQSFNFIVISQKDQRDIKIAIIIIHKYLVNFGILFH